MPRPLGSAPRRAQALGQVARRIAGCRAEDRRQRFPHMPHAWRCTLPSMTMRIDQLLAEGRPSFSFEFFPPHTEAATEALFATIAHLRDLEPTFVSVTCGANGSARTRTVELVKRIHTELGIEPMAHLTC